MQTNLAFQAKKIEFPIIHSNTKKVYEYWRIRILYSIVIEYAAFYLVRQNFSMAIPHMISEYHYTKSDIGWIISWGALIYGVGKGICGFITDHVSARFFMSIGLMLSAVVSFSIGLSSGLTSLLILVCLNNCFQSTGAAPCIRLLAHWFSPKELATKWSIWNASQQIGGALVLILSGFFLKEYGWRYVFFIPGVISLLAAFLLINRLRDTPESLDLPSIEHYHGLKTHHSTSEENSFSKGSVLKQVLTNKLVWYMALANFFVYFVRMSVFNWGPTFLKECKGSSLLMAGWQTATFDVAGIIGGILAGYLSDKVFKGYRGRVGTIYMGLLTFCILLLWKSPAESTFFHFIGMACIGFLVVGPQILVGVAAADFASKRAAAAANGLTGIVGYIGTAATGLGIGKLVDSFGWDMAFLAMLIAAGLSALFFILTWNHRAKSLN